MNRHFNKNWIIYFVISLYLVSCGAKSEQNIDDSYTKVVPIAKSESKEIKKLTIENKPTQNLQQQVLLDVPLIHQNPELKNGCEVTSLAMVLRYAGIQVDKLELADKLKKDMDPITRNETGEIVSWGNPKHGFVGDITGKSKGYAVYVEPVAELMNEYLPRRTYNLSGTTLDDLKKQLSEGKPIVIWATGYFKYPIQWDRWRHGNETIDATFDLHAVVLVGYDSQSMFINDPLTGEKAQKIDQQTFIQVWNELGKQALSYQ